jgi:hypothetical protein
MTKIIRAKWTRGVAQEALLCKHKALSSNRNPTKKKIITIWRIFQFEVLTGVLVGESYPKLSE